MAIKKPKGMNGSILMKRAKASFDKDTGWRDVLEDAYDYFLPQREVISIHAIGQKKMDKIFDSTAIYSTKEFANRMQANLTPIWREWASFDISAEVEASLEAQGTDANEIKTQLQQTAKVVFDYINHSNFATQINEAYLDLAIGTTLIMVHESDDPNQLIEFQTQPQIDIGFEKSSSGRVENCFKKTSYPGRDAERKYPGIELPEHLVEQVKESPEKEIGFINCMIFDSEFRKYWWLVIPEGSQKIVWSQQYDNLAPWVVGRWSVIAGETRGRGPALDVLPDVKSLNKVKEFALKKAAIDLSGIWTAVDDGVTNPYTIRIQPGIVIPVGSNDRAAPSLQRLDTTNDLSLTQFLVPEMQTNIKRALFNDLRDPNGAVRSATEVSIDARELAQRMGSAFGRLQTEVLEPILQRVIEILVRHKKIPPIKIDGKLITIKFTSPLSRAQDSEELLAVEQAVQFVLSTSGPENIPMVFDIDKFGEFAADKTGMDQRLVRDQEGRQQVQQSVLDVAQAQQDATTGATSGEEETA